MNTLAQTEATIVALNALLRLREQEVSGLRAELAACREDAERYRWLRTGKGWPAVFSGANEPEPVTGDELDAMVDYVCKGEGE